ncbi:MAG: arsenate reductase family protein [Eggerthellaceae bacterium]|nr:arsenate reductase family protein [Eggerthellaceae bacterium]
MMLFVEYPKCSTCKKAKAWLDDNNIEFDDRHIVEDNPTADELRLWHKMSELPLRRFFNTSGMLYRELELKDKLPNMSEDEMYDLLASNGMLVKRPLLVLDDTVLVGFREKEWAALLD